MQRHTQEVCIDNFGISYKIPVLKDVKEMLQGIWKHYHYSAKAVRELKEVAEGMEVRAYKAVKVDGTRWVPHMQRALNILSVKKLSSCSFALPTYLPSKGCQ